MAKVVGKDERATRRVTCESCASIAEYTEGEVKEWSGTDYGGGPAGRKWIVCPECGKDITIESW